MSELIDREALMKYPIRINNYDKEHGNEHFVLGIESVLEFAENLPIISVPEVVHCKGCKHRWTDRCALYYGNANNKMYFCGAMSDDNFSCSDGKRREESGK